MFAIKCGLVGYGLIGCVHAVFANYHQRESIKEFNRVLFDDQDLNTNPFVQEMKDYLIQEENASSSVESILWAGLQGIGWILTVKNICENTLIFKKKKELQCPNSSFGLNDMKVVWPVLKLVSYRSHIFKGTSVLTDMYNSFLHYKYDMIVNQITVNGLN